MRLMRKVRGKVSGESQAGFTIVELLTVLTVSVIIMAGMVGLIEMATNALTQSRSLEAVTDSARRSLSSISRQVKTALHIDDANTSATQFSFWGDVDNDNPTADVDHYTDAEYVRFFRSGTNLMQQTTHPPGDPTQANVTTTISLASNVSSVQFLYYAAGDNTNTLSSGYNSGAGMVKVILGYKRTTIARNFEQDMFLRILVRSQ